MFPVRYCALTTTVFALFIFSDAKVSAGLAAFERADPAASPMSIAGGGVLWLAIVICSGIYLLLHRH